jgi:ketosteroid isomerase-like protein
MKHLQGESTNQRRSTNTTPARVKSINMMRNRITLAVLLILIAGLGLSASSGSDHKSPETIANEIIALEKASFQAWQRKDKQFYTEYWADDFTEFLPQSPTLTTNPKVSLLPHLEQSFDEWNLIDIQMHEPRVQIYGDVAVLTYTESVQGSYKGTPSSYTGKVTMIYVKKNGKWRGVHYHESETSPAR